MGCLCVQRHARGGNPKLCFAPDSELPDQAESSQESSQCTARGEIPAEITGLTKLYGTGFGTAGAMLKMCVFVEGRLARTRNNDQHTQQRPWGRNERDIFVGELEPCIFERYADIVELGKSRVTSVAGSVVLP